VSGCGAHCEFSPRAKNLSRSDLFQAGGLGPSLKRGGNLPSRSGAFADCAARLKRDWANENALGEFMRSFVMNRRHYKSLV
jgi:hypothetical protein